MSKPKNSISHKNLKPKLKILSDKTTFNNENLTVEQEVLQEIELKSNKKSNGDHEANNRPTSGEVKLPKLNFDTKKDSMEAAISSSEVEIVKIISQSVQLPKLQINGTEQISNNKFLDIFQLEDLGLLKLDDYKIFESTVS